MSLTTEQREEMSELFTYCKVLERRLNKIKED